MRAQNDYHRALEAKYPDKFKKVRPASSSLIRLAHWSRIHINDDELMSAQLPHQVPTKKKPAQKPIHW
jgi:hypothetical protein